MIKGETVTANSLAELRKLRERNAQLEDLLVNSEGQDVAALSELEQRSAELAVIHAVQTGLASQLEMQEIVDIVGEKIRDIFNVQDAHQDLYIALIDEDRDIVHFPYYVHQGQRVEIDSRPVKVGLTAHVVKTRAPLVLNEDTERRAAEIGVSYVSDDETPDRSWIGVPMIAGERVIGVISLSDLLHEHAYPDTAVSLLITLAASTGVALENARLFAETKRLLAETDARASELAVINGVQQALAEKLDMQGVVDVVGDTIRDIFRVQEVFVALVDYQTGLINFPYFLERGVRVAMEPMPLGAGLTGRIISTHQPIILNEDVNRKALELGAVSSPDGEPDLAWAGMPMVVGDSVIGVITLSSREEENAFPENAVNLLTTIAASTGVALENARLFAETKRLLAETDERASELAVINAVQQALAEQLDMQGVVDVVGDKIREIFNIQGAHQDSFIALVDEETNLIHFPYFIVAGERIESQPVPLGEGLTSQVVQSRAPLVLNEDTERRAIDLGAVIQGDNQTMDRSWIGVPMNAGERVIGVISLSDSLHEHAYPDTAVSLLTTLAASTGVALENARLFAETKRLLTETDARASELAVINAVQHALAEQLDMQGVVDVVGDKIREIFNIRHTHQDLFIALIDEVRNLAHFPYYVSQGQRIDIGYRPFGEGLTGHVVNTRATLVFNEDTDRRQAEIGAVYVSDDEPPDRSWMAVPMIVGERVIGIISLSDKLHEHAYPESAVSLLTTLAASTGVALENARLFAEIKRLLAETDERASELAVINAVQQGLAAQLDMQGIVDVVGDKIREIFGDKSGFIALIDHDAGMVHTPYYMAGNKRIDFGPFPIDTGLTGIVVSTRQPLVLNEDAERRATELGAIWVDEENEDEITRSWIGVPMSAGDRVIGVISLTDTRHEHAFPDSAVSLLTTLAASTGVALENARLFAETKRLLDETDERASELAVINAVQQALAEKLDMQGVVDVVGDTIRDIFKLRGGFIALADYESELIHFPYYLYHGERIEAEPLPLGTGLTGRIISTRQPIVLNEDTQRQLMEMGAVTAVDDEDPDLSWAGVPMIAGDKVIGVITLASQEHEHAFPENAVTLLTTIAASTGVALESARLFAETKRLLAETNERAAELGTVNAVSQALTSELDLDALIELTGEQVRKTFAADIVTVALLNKNTNMIDFPYSYGEEDDESIPLGEGMTSRIILTRDPLLINEDVLGLQATLEIQPIGVQAMSYLGVPIIAGDEAIGAISVQSTTHEGRFAGHHSRLLSTIAANVGAAIENARLYQQTQRQATEMAALAEISREVSATLDLNSVLELIASRASEVLNARDVVLFMLEPDGRLPAVIAIGENSEHLKAVSLELGKGIVGSVAQTGLAEIVNDPLQDPRIVRVPGTEREEEHEAILFAPLISRERVTGVIGMWRDLRIADTFVQSDLDFVNGLARQAAIAIENAGLFQAAQDARVASEHANLTKSTFLANMSHELRTPLNAIIGFTRIVKRHGSSTLPEKQLDNLDRVLVSADHLLGLINTILDIGKIEAGRMDVQVSTFGLPALLDVCVNTTQPLLRPGVALEVVAAPDLPLISSDQDKIKQIVLNLLSNAAKFTEVGSISVRVRHDERWFNVSVADTGIGIPDEALDRVFEEFQQADSSTTRKYGGTGLGLSISRHLARLLGGDLTVESSVDLGSAFTLTLPVSPGESPPISVPGGDISASSFDPASGQHEALVLAIDDDPDAVYLLQENLAETGYRVVGLLDSREAVKKASELMPMAITLDIVMPGKDGWQVLHDLKLDPRTSDIPVILITIVDKKALGYKLGAADYLVKPLDRDALLSALGRIAEVDAGSRDRTLLIIDDDPNVIDIVQQMLSESGFELVSAKDGETGLELIHSHQFDAVLLDLMLPGIDGFSVLEELRRDPGLASLPVIILTAKDLTSGEAATLRESASRVIQKQQLEAHLLLQELQTVMPASTAAPKTESEIG